MDINLPDVVAEVTAQFKRYETALVSNDVGTLNALFWNNGLTLRFGLNENLYGHAAIAGFRAARSPAGLMRTTSNTVITTYGRDFAPATTEFRRPQAERGGRQSQTRARIPEASRRLSARVSRVRCPPA